MLSLFIPTPSHFWPRLTGDLFPLFQKIPTVAVMLTPRRRFVPPWTSYVAITRHWRMTSTISDKANMSLIPHRRWNCWTPSHSQMRYGASVLEGFKPHSLSKFNGRNDQYEHVSSINTQMAIRGAPDSLKCKLLSSTFRNVTLRWCIDLPHASINNYQGHVKNVVHLFAPLTTERCLPQACLKHAKIH